MEALCFPLWNAVRENFSGAMHLIECYAITIPEFFSLRNDGMGGDKSRMERRDYSHFWKIFSHKQE
jgi:hypothetical protein